MCCSFIHSLVFTCAVNHSLIYKYVSFIYTYVLLDNVNSTRSMRDMTHSYLRHDSCICVAWVCDTTHWYVQYYCFICVTSHISICDTTQLYVRQDLFGSAAWLSHVWDMLDNVHSTRPISIHVCDMTHSHVWRDSFAFECWLLDNVHSTQLMRIHVCDMTHSYV